MKKRLGIVLGLLLITSLSLKTVAKIEIHPDQAISCHETHTSDPKISHSIFGQPLQLLYTGISIDGNEVWGAYDQYGVQKFSLPLMILANGFQLGSFSFQEIDPYNFQAKLIQQNSAPLNDVFETEHTVNCRIQ